MLRSELPFQPRAWALKPLLLVLGEPFLGFLAIVSAALTMVPMLFVVTPRIDALLEAGQWSIIAVFAVEYVFAFSFAPRKRTFVVNPWRLVDLVTIVVPLLTFFPQISDVLRSSPVLRLIRLVRVAALGVRAGGVIVREEVRRTAALSAGHVEVAVFRVGKSPTLGLASWNEFLQWAKAPGHEWYHVSNLGAAEIKEVASAVGTSQAHIESHFFGAGYPRLEVTERHAALFVWLPEFGFASSVERSGLLLLATNHGIFTLSRRHSELLSSVAVTLPRLDLASLPFPVQMTCVFLQVVLMRNEELVGWFERQIRELEEVPVRESRPQFFEQTFRLKNELSAAQSDLWRLKGILNALAESRVKLPGGGVGESDFLRTLAETADWLYETVVNTREELLSLIDLHLNVVSFEMNRVMRVLAVVSVLGLIPAVVGGLLGMNLSDNPWPFTLPQVAFGVCLGMVLCLYLFLVKGWLR